MGACILCGKSAGPFYSLHKQCFDKYDTSKQAIAELLLEQLGRTDPLELAQAIQNKIIQFGFKDEACNRTLNRSLEYFHKQHVDVSSATVQELMSWIDLLDALDLDESLFVNKNFLVQQRNLLAIQSLKNNQLPECNCNEVNFSISFRDNEHLWWCFNETALEHQVPFVKKRQWSVIMQLVESLLAKKNKSSLKNEGLGQGKLLITNQRVCFDNAEKSVYTEFRDIYSCTPTTQGITLQTNEASSRPHTFYCEDARLLYSLIRYAQKKLCAR